LLNIQRKCGNIHFAQEEKEKGETGEKGERNKTHLANRYLNKWKKEGTHSQFTVISKQI
jgi:hypothetical protein